MFDQAAILPQAISTTQPMYRDIKFSREKKTHTGRRGLEPAPYYLPVERSTTTLSFINPASVQNSRRVIHLLTI